MKYVNKKLLTELGVDLKITEPFGKLSLILSGFIQKTSTTGV